MADSQFTAATGNDGITAPGYVGSIANLIPVFMSDRMTVTEGTPDTYSALLQRGKPLAFGQKRSPEVETQRDILKRTTYVSSSLLYCAGLIRADHIGILVTQ